MSPGRDIVEDEFGISLAFDDNYSASEGSILHADRSKCTGVSRRICIPAAPVLAQKMGHQVLRPGEGMEDQGREQGQTPLVNHLCSTPTSCFF